MSYITAIYLRLSDDDTDLDMVKTESNSISGQRTIIRNFINNNTELKNTTIKEYCDDGYSGVNFKRPNITKLLEDIKSGIINCIIVKDLSRFGRNLIEVGNYLEQIFPIFNIRFIAINDNYDSTKKSSYSSNIEIAFRNLMNEEYSRDISTKVKATKKIQKKQGLFIGGYAPFGYKLKNKQLIIDKYAADIIRKIFKMAEMGVSFINIAKALNSENVPSRGSYMRISNKKSYWKAKDISNILHNEIYIGTLINNQKENISPRVTKENSNKDWLIFENHHDAIIDKDTFENVKKYFHKPSPRKFTNCFYNEFKKKVYCKGCGELIRRHYKGNSFYYICDYGTDTNCCKNKIYIEDLKSIVKIFIENYINLMSNKLTFAKQQYIETKNSVSERISPIDSEIKQLENKILVEYEDYSNNIISKEEFILRREKLSYRIYTLNLRKEKINTDLKLLENIAETENIIEKYNSAESVTDEIISVLVKKIYISSVGEIDIDLNFRDDFIIKI